MDFENTTPNELYEDLKSMIEIGAHRCYRTVDGMASALEFMVGEVTKNWHPLPPLPSPQQLIAESKERRRLSEEKVRKEARSQMAREAIQARWDQLDEAERREAVKPANEGRRRKAAARRNQREREKVMEELEQLLSRKS